MLKRIIQLFKDALSGKEESFTTGSIRRAIMLLSIPMVIEMIGEGIFALVDAFFVSKISTAAVTTIGLTETVATLIYSLAIGISIAATATVARRIGEEKLKEAADAGVQAIWLSGFVAFILAILGGYFADDILWLLSKDEEVVAVGTNYTRLLFGSNIVIVLLFVLNGVFRGAGNASMAMKSLWIANGLNIILDPLLIFGIGFFPELGLLGAAVATTIGRGTGVLFQLYILFNGGSIIKMSWQHFKIIPQTLKKMANVATTGALQFAVASCSWIFVAGVIADLGKDVFAGYTFAIRLIIFAILPAWGIANAAATLVGQNLGAKQADRAEASVWKASSYNAVFMGTIGIIFFIFAKPLISIFSTEEIVLQTGVLCLRIFCLGNVFYSYGMVMGQAFGGAGDTRTPTLINLVCFWVIEIPLAYLLAIVLDYGVLGAMLAIIGAESILAVIAIIIFRKGRWKTVEI